MKQTKRPIRKARRKARRAKVKTTLKELNLLIGQIIVRMDALEEAFDAVVETKSKP